MATAPKVSADAGATLSTIRNLWTYLAADRPDLRRRVVLPLPRCSPPRWQRRWCRLPIRASSTRSAPPAPEAAVILGLAVPIVFVIAYGVGQIVDAGFQQLCDILLRSVGQHAVRRLAYETFVHIHRLSLRFHLQRKTGGLSRIIERGTKGIETIVRFTMSTPLHDHRIRDRGIVFGVCSGGPMWRCCSPWSRSISGSPSAPATGASPSAAT